MLTQEKFNNKIKEKYGDKYTVIGEYQKWDMPIKIKCNNCGYDFDRTPNSLTAKGRKTHCPRCEGKLTSSVVVEGITDLCSTDPDIADLLEDKTVGKKYKRNSIFETWFICPDCGHRHFDKIKNVTKRGFKCKCCGCTSLYPNQFLYNLLDILGVEFRPEYQLDGYKYRYDAFFIYNNKKYLVEMDGAYGHGCVDTASRTIDEQIKDDANKDIIALQNGYILIRVDCKYTGSDDKFEYVKNSIYNSELLRIFSITDEDLNEANYRASIPKIKTVLSLWDDGIRSYDVFGDKLHSCRPTIRNLLHRCSDFGLIKKSYQDICSEMRIASNKKLAISKGIPVICNETGEIFYSISEAERQTGFHIRSFFSQNRKYAGVLPDGTKLTWTKLETV